MVLSAALLRILELSHEALVTGIITTKRQVFSHILLTRLLCPGLSLSISTEFQINNDISVANAPSTYFSKPYFIPKLIQCRDIYYRDPDLFVKQAVVDRYLDDLAFTLNISRDALNVVATAKGLIAGSLLVHKHDGQIIDCRAENEVFFPFKFTSLGHTNKELGNPNPKCQRSRKSCFPVYLLDSHHRKGSHLPYPVHVTPCLYFPSWTRPSHNGERLPGYCDSLSGTPSFLDAKLPTDVCPH